MLRLNLGLAEGEEKELTEEGGIREEEKKRKKKEAGYEKKH